MAAPQLYFVGSCIWISALLIEYSTRRNRDQRLAGLSRNALARITYRQLVFTMATIFSFIVLGKEHAVSRLFLVSFFAVQAVWFWWSNLYGFRILHRHLYKRARSGLSPTLIIGNTGEVEEFMGNPTAPKFPGLDFRGFVSPDTSVPNYSTLGDLQALGRFQDIRQICQKSDIKAILLLGMQDRDELVQPVLRLTDDFGLRTMWIDNIDRRFGKKFHPFHTDNYSIVSHLNEPLENPVNRFWKRGFDIVASAIGLIFVLPPAMLLVWMIQRRNGPGPLFYRQERTGRNGAKFNIYKFRSMRVNGKDDAPTTKNDNRIYPGGLFIRKTSIDELPQLINVFIGDMSIVGPRPHADFTDDEHADFTHLYRLRSLVKPGITGLAQSKGFRGETINTQQIKNRIRLDLFYIQKWKLSLDILIVLLTLIQVIKPPNTAL